MPTREEIREGIARITHHWHCPSEKWEERDNYLSSLGWLGPEPEYYYKLADELLPYLHSQGVVIKVDRELLKKKTIENHLSSWANWYEGQQDMLKAGYVAVAPLVEK